MKYGGTDDCDYYEEHGRYDNNLRDDYRFDDGDCDDGCVAWYLGSI